MQLGIVTEHRKATEEDGDQAILGKDNYLDTEMWTAGYKYSWRKMEAAAQDGTGFSSGLWPMFHWG